MVLTEKCICGSSEYPKRTSQQRKLSQLMRTHVHDDAQHHCITAADDDRAVPPFGVAALLGRKLHARKSRTRMQEPSLRCRSFREPYDPPIGIKGPTGVGCQDGLSDGKSAYRPLGYSVWLLLHDLEPAREVWSCRRGFRKASSVMQACHHLTSFSTREQC
jgi:hypothetical protein